MLALIERLQKEGSTRQDARRLSKQASTKPAKGRPRNFVFRFQPREKSFTLALQFKRAQVPKDEIVRALQAVIDEIQRS